MYCTVNTFTYWLSSHSTHLQYLTEVRPTLVLSPTTHTIGCVSLLQARQTHHTVCTANKFLFRESPNKANNWGKQAEQAKRFVRHCSKESCDQNNSFRKFSDRCPQKQSIQNLKMYFFSSWFVCFVCFVRNKETVAELSPFTHTRIITRPSHSYYHTSPTLVLSLVLSPIPHTRIITHPTHSYYHPSPDLYEEANSLQHF